MNLATPTDWGTECPFLDVFKMSRAWELVPSGELHVDKQGWVTELASGQVARTYIFSGDTTHYPIGTYILTYEGEGTFAFGDNIEVIDDRQPGRLVLRVGRTTGEVGIMIDITSVKPGRHLRNIRLRMPSNAPDGEIFNPEFLRRLRPFRALRFMGWMLGDSFQQLAMESFGQRPQVADARWNVKGVPLEIMIALCNRLEADPWFTLPYNADIEKYVIPFAQMVKERLNDGLRVHVENANEVWNGAYQSVHDDAIEKGEYLGFVPEEDEVTWGSGDGLEMAGMRYNAYRTCLIADAFTEYVGANRVVRVLATHPGVPACTQDMLTFRPFGDSLETVVDHIDAVATAPYFGIYDAQVNRRQVLEAMDLTSLMNYLRDVSVPEQVDLMVRQGEIARASGLPLIAYEGGQSVEASEDARGSEMVRLRFDAANRDARMGQRYAELLAAWHKVGGLFNHCDDCEAMMGENRWGALEYIDQPRQDAPKYDALVTFTERLATMRSTQPIVGLGAGGQGAIADLFADGAVVLRAGSVALPWEAYNTVSGETRPAAGNLDDDPGDELVVGLPSRGSGYLAVLDDVAHGRRLLQWLRVGWSAYNASNGESYPACGDIDGDGRDEIVVGLGARSSGYLEVFRGRAGSIAHVAWIRNPRTAYDSALGESHPAMGDLDGDGDDDLVVGLGSHLSSGGYLAQVTSDGAALRFARWARVPWSAYVAASGESWPACGDVNGDGRAEVVVGLGSYPAAGGWVLLLGDATTGLTVRGWYQAGWREYDARNGEIRPALGDVNGDGRADLLVGTGSGGGGRVGVSPSNGTGFGAPRWFQASSDAYAASNGETWTTFGDVR